MPMRRGEGLEWSFLRMLRGALPVYVHIGQITKIRKSADFGFLIDGIIRPDGRPFQARLQWAGTGNKIGDFWPVKVDEEILVLVPEGNPNHSIAIAGLTSRPALPPSDFDNTGPVLVHPKGKEFRTTEGAAIEAVLKAVPFQGDINENSKALQSFMSAVFIAFGVHSAAGPPTPISNGAFLSSIGTAAASYLADPDVSTFLIRTAAGFYSAKAVKSD